MSRTTPAWIGLLVALAAGSGATAQARPLPAGALRVKPAEIIDRHGFEKPLVAATMLVPLGWKGEGGVEWNPMDPRGGEGYRFNWKATAPDGVGAIAVLPAERWSHGNFPMPQNNCLSSTASGVRAYLEWFVQRSRPGARVLDFRARPDLAAPYQQLAQLPATPGMRTWVEGGELLIGCARRSPRSPPSSIPGCRGWARARTSSCCRARPSPASRCAPRRGSSTSRWRTPSASRSTARRSGTRAYAARRTSGTGW